jgi:hypothetical protein
MIAWVSWTPLVLGLGCAGGVEHPDTTFGPPGGPVGGGTSDTESMGDELDDEDDDDPFPDPDPIDTTTGSPPDETTWVGDDTTTSPPPDETTDDGGPMGECPNLATCQGASGIGLVSGDEGSRTIGASGSEPTWIEFQVTENDDSLVGTQLTFTATLLSPAGADFDLYVYRSGAGGASGCNGTMQSSMSVGAQDAVSMTWGEGVVPNGLDDGAWVAVEIRAKDDICAPPQEWMLTIEGNT